MVTQVADYKTGSLLDYPYFKEHHKILHSNIFK